MKLHVLYDQTGHIVAAVRLDVKSAGKRTKEGMMAGAPRPSVPAGHSAADVVVPHEHSSLTLDRICQALYVHVADGQTALKARE